MTVTGTPPPLQCDHDQPVFPLQNITCHCVAINQSTIFWRVDSELVVWVTDKEEILGNDANYPVTVKVLENGLLASNLSLIIAGPVTVQCQYFVEIFNQSYSIVGTLLEVFVLLRYLSIK